MNVQWDGSEFFKMMAHNEKIVGDFYRLVAKDAKIGGKFFENLAKDEDRHMKIYHALLEKHQSDKKLYVEVDKEHGEYLNLLVKSNILRDADALMQSVAKFKDKDQVYELAEKVERDAVLFVEELAKLYQNQALADFEIVLQEEKNHLKQVLARRMESKLTSLKL